ncbi:hypothetical protein MBLNU459_g4990t2 [Dothideomycetes sp. NU459]
MSPFRKVKTILLVTAQHESATPFDPGFAAIEQAFSSLTDAWNIVMVSKCKRQDLQEALSVYQPTILHFCGHANPKGLALEDAHGLAELLTYDDLAQMLEPARRSGLCSVFLSCCYSSVRGQIIADAVGGIVVAMKGLVREDAAAQFAQFFYRTLGSGWSFWRSYEEILNRLRNDPAMSRFYGRIDPVIFYPQQL